MSINRAQSSRYTAAELVAFEVQGLQSAAEIAQGRGDSTR